MTTMQVAAIATAGRFTLTPQTTLEMSARPDQRTKPHLRAIVAATVRRQWAMVDSVRGCASVRGHNEFRTPSDAQLLSGRSGESGRFSTVQRPDALSDPLRDPARLSGDMPNGIWSGQCDTDSETHCHACSLNHREHV